RLGELRGTPEGLAFARNLDAEVVLSRTTSSEECLRRLILHIGGEVRGPIVDSLRDLLSSEPELFLCASRAVPSGENTGVLCKVMPLESVHRRFRDTRVAFPAGPIAGATGVVTDEERLVAWAGFALRSPPFLSLKSDAKVSSRLPVNFCTPWSDLG